MLLLFSPDLLMMAVLVTNQSCSTFRLLLSTTCNSNIVFSVYLFSLEGLSLVPTGFPPQSSDFPFTGFPNHWSDVTKKVFVTKYNVHVYSILMYFKLNKASLIT